MTPRTPRPEQPCPACGAPLTLVWVHGHGQCANCGTNVVPCCMGAGEEADQHRGDALTLSVDEVLAAFAKIAGPSHAVTLDALLHALAEQHESSYDAARAAIDRAVQLRRLAVQGRIVRRVA